MNTTTKLIITDTNILTDLDCAGVLECFVNLDNVYISDMIKNDEINNDTGNVNVINKIKVISSTSEEIKEMMALSVTNKKLSKYDLITYIIAKNHKAILATGDNRLRNFAILNKVDVIRTLGIIKMLYQNGIITIDKLIKACDNLMMSEKSRIPSKEILNMKEEYMSLAGN